MKIEQIKLKDLKLYANNNKKHPESQIEVLKKSIDEFGFRNPVLIDKDTEIVAGHGRCIAAKELGLEEVPCIRIEDLSKEQIKALRIMDNKSQEYAEWDFDSLKEEFTDLDVAGYDLDLTGFSFDEIVDITADPNAPKPLLDIEEDTVAVDAYERARKKCKIQVGDIFQIGNHWLMCGDSTKKEDVDKLMNGNKADLIYTDPPYGMNAVSKSGVLSKNYRKDIVGDDNNTIAIKSFKLFNNYAPFNIWWGANYYSECLPSSECWLVWDKNNGGSDQTDCELAWTNFRSVVRQYTQSSEKTNRVHPTQKPVSLFNWSINRFATKGNFKNILDLFGGSGSTMMACEQLNRICYMMEIDPFYCQVIIDRLYKYNNQIEIKCLNRDFNPINEKST